MPISFITVRKIEGVMQISGDSISHNNGKLTYIIPDGAVHEQGRPVRRD